MTRHAVAAVLVLLAAAPPASAGVFAGTTRDDDGVRRGKMTYTASRGVANDVSVEAGFEGEGRASRILVRDLAERVRAGGECVELDRHTVSCPWTEDEPPVVVLAADRDDRVEVRQVCQGGPGPCRHLPVTVRGGKGDDTLTGGGEFFGERGDDVLYGSHERESWDRFHGGPGRDTMDGNGHHRNGLQDQFFDDETDGQAARDVVIAGRNARASIDYSRRRRAMRVDLHDSRIGPERDRVSGVKSITTGAGDDVLIGTGGPNELGGGPGRDRLYGRLGDDVLSGGLGDDAMYGEEGDDALAEPSLYGVYSGPGGGRDRFFTGPGTDEVRSYDSLDRDGRTEPDYVRCEGRDKPVSSDPSDRLRGCRTVAGWDLGELELRVVPVLRDGGATFTLRCAPTEFEERRNPQTGELSYLHRCRGELIVSRRGAEYGRQSFSFEMENYRTPWVEVTVPLSAEGMRAARGRKVVHVTALAQSSEPGFRYPPAGYRSALVR